MSKGLKALEELKECIKLECVLDYINEERINIIEKELKELEERREMMRRFNEACVPMILDNETEQKLKALEIIKNKKVDVKYLYYRAEFNVEKYNDNYIETLTQEEYELLKEVLS